MTHRRATVFIGLPLVWLLALLCGGCGGGGGGGTSSPPKPPQPPWTLRIYEGAHRERIVCQGTVSTTEQGRYQVTWQGGSGSTFRRQEVRVEGERIALPIGPRGQETVFSWLEFRKGMGELKAGREAEVRSVSSGLTYVIQPSSLPPSER